VAGADRRQRSGGLSVWLRWRPVPRQQLLWYSPWRRYQTPVS
jgi:hypothetical protein